MDDLSKVPAEDAANQPSNESPNIESTGEVSDAAISLGDLSDVDTEVDEAVGMLSPSLFAPLLHTGDDQEEPGFTPNKVEPEAQSSSTDPFASLFDGLVITGQEEEEKKQGELVLLAENEAEAVSPKKLQEEKQEEEAVMIPPSDVVVDKGIDTVESIESPLYSDILHAEKSPKEEEKEEERKALAEEETPNFADSSLLKDENSSEPPSIAPFSAVDTDSAADTFEFVPEKEESQLIIKEPEPSLSKLEPPPQGPLPPPALPRPQPPLQQQQEQIKNKKKVHYPDIPGASLLELAEHAESRLAFGATEADATRSTLPIMTTTTTGGAASIPPSLESSPFVASIPPEEGWSPGVSHLSEIDNEEAQAFRKQLLVARLVSQLETSPAKTTPPTEISNTTTTTTSLDTSNTSINQQNTSTATAMAGSSVAAAGSFQSKNTSMGTNLAARAFISPQLEPLFKRAGAPYNSIPSVISKYLGIVAVGTSAGSVHVLMPKAGGRGPPQLHALEDRSVSAAGGDAITAIALGQHAGGLLLVAGHNSGQLRLWETKPVSGGGGGSSSSGGIAGAAAAAGVTWVLARTVNGVHASAVTACTVIDGGTTTWALSADAHGRLMCHNVARLLSITAQALAGFARQWAGGGAAAAAASASTLVSLEAAGQDPGVVLSLTPLGNSTGSGTSASTTHPQQQQQQHAAKTLYMIAEGSHFLLLVATRAVLLAALSSEGSLTILHIFFPPPIHQEGETAGCAAWHLEDAHVPTSPMMRRTAGAQHATHAIVSIAWGTSVSIYRCALTRPSKASPQSSPSKRSPRAGAAASGGGGSGGSPSRPAAAPLSPPQLFSTFSSEHPVSGIGFIAPLGALVVASAAGEVETEITIYHPSVLFSKKEESVDKSKSGGTAADGTVEKLKISDWMVVRQLGIPGAASLHGSLATSSGGGGGGGGSDQLLLLTSRGVRVIHLLTWHQRLSTLVGMQKLEVAMLSAVRLYLQATVAQGRSAINILPGGAGSSIGGGGSPVSSGLCLWPADGAAASDAEEVARQLLTILHAFIDSKLHSMISQRQENKKALFENDAGLNVQGKDEEEELLAEQFADIAVNTCLMLSRSDALFDDIAPKFLSSPYASVFLSQLEPRILADELPSLAPEVMQALVEHFAHSGQLERIERCVLKLDILSLDLNQLIPLCLRHGLYGALIHIFIGALQDYQTPATLLLIAAATAATASAEATSQQTKIEEAEQMGKHGHSDNSSAVSTATHTSNKDRLENSLALHLGYRLLVYLRGCLSGLQYPPGSGPAPAQQQQAMRLHAVTFLLHVNTAMLLDTWQLWASVAHLDSAESGDGTGVTPSLSSLPSNLHGPSPVLRYLCQMDAPAVLGVLCDGLKGWDALESDLVDLSPELGPLILSAQNSSKTTSAGGRTITQAAVDAVVQLLQEEGDEKGALKSGKEAALLKFVSEHLAAQRASADDAVLLRVLRFLAEQESKTEGGASAAAAAASAVQKAGELSLVERESIFKDIVVHIHGNSGNNNTNCRNDSQVRGEALDLARKAGFRQAEARIRHSERAFSQAFSCLVEDGNRYPLAPFQYLKDICFDPGLTESDRNLVKSTALKLAPQLVRINAEETAAVVAECFSQESHVAVLEALAPWPDDQFAFLQAAIEGSNSRSSVKSGDAQRPGSGLSTSTSTRPMSPESTLDSFRGDPLFAPLLNNKNVSSLYVRLLCRFQPSDVLPFLQAHDTYNVDECLKHCIDHGAREAASFLLERKGDIQAALKMYLQQVDVANEALVAAVKKYGVDGIPSYYSYSTPTSRTGVTSSGSSPQTASQVAKMATRTTTTAPGTIATLPPASRLAESPLSIEFVGARDAMNSAVSMCVRFAQDRVTPLNSPAFIEQDEGELGVQGRGSISDATTTTTSSSSAENITDTVVGFTDDPVRAVWFEVLQRYVTIIRKLRAEEKAENNATASTATETALSSAADVSSLERLTCLERIFTAFMEEVISQMAGHVPLHSIAAAVLHTYSKDSFGDFRATLSSLLGACNFELAILRCASRVTGTDTIALLKQGYKQCMMPQAVATAQEDQENINIIQGSSGSGYCNLTSRSSSNSQMSMNAALRSLESAQQIGHDAWAKAAAAAGPAASKLMEKAGFA